MQWLTANPWQLLETAVKAILLFVTALGALRLTDRRTLAELAPFDLVTVVSIGGIVSRTATASGTGFLVGAVALLSILLTHQVVARIRLRRRLRPLLDRPVVRLIDEGQLMPTTLRRSGLIEDDVYAALRQRGVERLSDVRYMFYETRGRFSIIGWSTPTTEEPVASALAMSSVERD
jgi:uncharacterized membrane protein YcaP (DUF421 family)